MSQFPWLDSVCWIAKNSLSFPDLYPNGLFAFLGFLGSIEVVVNELTKSSVISMGTM